MKEKTYLDFQDDIDLEQLVASTSWDELNQLALSSIDELEQLAASPSWDELNQLAASSIGELEQLAACLIEDEGLDYSFANFILTQWITENEMKLN